jgi:hypothetical protein
MSGWHGRERTARNLPIPINCEPGKVFCPIGDDTGGTPFLAPRGSSPDAGQGQPRAGKDTLEIRVVPLEVLMLHEEARRESTGDLGNCYSRFSGAEY